MHRSTGFLTSATTTSRPSSWARTCSASGGSTPRTSYSNRFHENVVWSTRGNFLSVPTDCPQRDERLGWTGDIQIFAPTAMFLFDAAGFLESWLEDLAAEQNPDGSVPFTIPDILRAPASSAAAWGDAAVPRSLGGVRAGRRHPRAGTATRQHAGVG